MTKRGGYNVFNGSELDISQTFESPKEHYRIHVWTLTAEEVEEVRKFLVEKFGPKTRMSVTGLSKTLGKPTYRSIDEEERDLRADDD